MKNTITTISILSLIILVGPTSNAFAQTRGEGTQDFFEQGERQLQQEVQRLQQDENTKVPQNPLPNPPDPNRQQEEQQLDQDLNIEQKDPEKTQVEETPAPPESLDPNVPESPDEEVQGDF